MNKMFFIALAATSSFLYSAEESKKRSNPIITITLPRTSSSPRSVSPKKDLDIMRTSIEKLKKRPVDNSVQKKHLSVTRCSDVYSLDFRTDENFVDDLRKQVEKK